ncbi:MAG: hypothetical protein KC492_12855 [Myxococcales bacterium]|nr:hypothetical protein [Myxococcales bacterium]
MGGEAQYLGAAVQALGAVCLGTVASVSGRRVTRRTVRLLPALAVTLALSLSHRDVRAESGCGDFGSLGVVLASAGAFLVGSVGSATSAGVLAAGNEDKDFSFFKGFAYGELGVAIYSVSYLALDNALGARS